MPTDSLFKPIEPGLFTPPQEGQPGPTRYPCAIPGFFYADLAANVSAVAMSRHPGGSWAGHVVVPAPGHIIGITAASTEARTAGTATVEVYKNSVATGITAVLNANSTTHTFGRATNPVGLNPGDRMNVAITSDASWLPVTADVEAAIWIVLDIP